MSRSAAVGASRRPGGPPGAALVAICLLLACARAAGAQAAGGTPAPQAAGAQAVSPRGPIEILPAGAQYGFRDPADPERFVWVFLDGVEIRMEGRVLRGRTLVAVLAAPRDAPAADGDPAPARPAGGEPADASGAAEPAVAPGVFLAEDRLIELFLDGDVSMEEGDERISGASYFLLDNRTGVVTVIDGELRSAGSRGLPLVARYELLRKLQSGATLMKELTYTSCSFARPHWHIRTPWARLDGPRPEGRVLSTGVNTVRVGDVPVLAWPGYEVNVDRDDLLLHRVHVGSSSRFGTEIVTEWEGDASSALAGLVGLFGADPEGLSATWSTELSWLSRRGFFIAPSLRYRTGRSRGRLRGAFINDTATNDHLKTPVPESSRGRIDLEHRTLVGEDGVLDIEVSRESDRAFLAEYYEDEFREEKPQETYVYYREAADNHVWNVLAGTRLNDFATQVEYLPHVEARVAGEPLPGGGFLTGRAFADNARLRPDDATGLPSARSMRAGAGGEGTWPFDLPNGDRVQLKALAESVVFEETVADGSETRFAGGIGAEWSRLFSGTGPASSDVWNIDGLRRIVEPRIAWLNRFAVSHEPLELLAIDEVERLDEIEVIELGLRDRIQTHQGGRVVTLLDTDLVLPYYPDAARDNAGESWGPLRVDTRWRPGADLPGLRDATLHWRAEIDVEAEHWSESYASFTTTIAEGRRLTIANAKVRRQFDFRTIAVEWLLNPKWTVGVFFQEDALTNDRVRTGLLLRQLAHCWFIDLELSTRRGTSAAGEDRDETQVRLRFRPVDSDPGQALLAPVAGGYWP